MVSKPRSCLFKIYNYLSFFSGHERDARASRGDKDIYIEDITNRDDKMNYENYLTKQINILTDDNYNYKIAI